MVLHDRRHNPAGHSIHNHFIVKALHLVRPGGLVAVLTSRFTMDARNPAARREIASLADLARRDPAARRRPPARRRHRRGDRPARAAPPRTGPPAGRRRVGAERGSPSWTAPRCRSTSTSWTTRRRCSASMGAVHGAYRADDLVVRPSGDTIAAFCRRPGRADRLAPGSAASAYAPADRHAEAPPVRGAGAARSGAARRVPAGPAGRHVHPRPSPAPSCRMPFRPARPPSCGELLGAARHRAGPAGSRGRLAPTTPRDRRAAGRTGPPLRQLPAPPTGR